MGSCESTERERKKGDEVLQAVGVAVGAGLVAWGLYSVLSGSDSTPKKWMKAPGRDSFILREDFERDPSGYFRGLRKDF
ncbi:hypothetical protein H6P81_017016 [Aristolochia fimbriata]|uniref:Uncharacterized protein n=1 Tax=Aristolochia fimbriata TaxID=158543 RepID=A0AAV7E1B3_ARIFI|nr:hypothetical protein H6P81_017016 [Aristolochia fimbriata]